MSANQSIFQNCFHVCGFTKEELDTITASGVRSVSSVESVEWNRLAEREENHEIK